MRKVFLLLVIPFFLFSQENAPRNRYGIFGGYGLNSHTADFKRLPDCPSCSPGYKDGSGSGLSLGVVLDIPLFSSFYLSSKFIYRDIGAKLISNEKTTIIVEGEPMDGEFQHSIESTLGIIGLEPQVKFNPIGGLYINGGANVSYLFKKDYSQEEKITKPAEYGTFLNPDGSDSHSRVRNKFSGTLQEANPLYFAPFLSLSYVIPLDTRSKFILEPEVSYYFGLTNIVNHQLVNKWKANTLAFGVSLKYSPAKPVVKEEIHREKYQIDTIRIATDVIAQKFSKGKEAIKVERAETDKEIIITKYISRVDTIFTPKVYTLEGKIEIVGLDESGMEISNPRFKVKEIISNRLDPLLNYIFFEDNSYKIPDRYIKLSPTEAKEFEIEKLFYDSTIQIYHNILNIIGKRLNEYPTAKITLIGCNSGQGAEKGNTELSRRRAEEVKSYLVKVWNIAEERIIIEARNLPQKPTTPPDEPDKIQENRRVEIISDNDKILEPIFIEKIDRIATPPTARFKLQAQSEAGIAKWIVTGYQQSDLANKFKVEGTGEIQPQVDWVLSQYQKITPKSPEPVVGELFLQDKKGNTNVTRTQTQPIEVIKITDTLVRKEGDYKIEKFSLILFDFDKATIEGINKKIVEFMRRRIQPNSEIEIIGYTDRTGTPEYNKQLSKRRADAVKEALNRPDAVAIGVGQERLLYDNNLPEGRFYCRTVEVNVKTRIK